ncbi:MULTISPECIES: hypothetical protein [Myxococcaceae]|uniref:hypothetical protein n=1 Tax=Myxococcaceae TaxID=31 RepID=UPI00129CC519|nr:MULTISPECIES: hypothetical protein [Myxococcaceae]MBF5045978.1 hypothetical protein [Simulacricoccus sp. 17bor-14]
MSGRSAWWLGAVLWLAACGSGTDEPEPTPPLVQQPGLPDAGTPDAGRPDGGGTPDAGPGTGGGGGSKPDAGTGGGGGGTVDGGTGGGGAPDAGSGGGGGTPDAGSGGGGGTAAPGTLGWHHAYGSGRLGVLDLATDRQGGSVVLAWGENGSVGGPVWQGIAPLVLARYDASGALLWSRALTGYGIDDVRAAAVAVTREGNILTAGYYHGAPDLGGGPLPSADSRRGLFIAKFGPDGHHVWSRGFLAHDEFADGPRPGSLTPMDVATDGTGSLIVTGALTGLVDLGGGELRGGYDSTESVEGLFLAKFNWDGTHAWSTTLPPGDTATDTLGLAVAADSQGRVLLGGRLGGGGNVLGAAGPETPFVARYSAGGTLQWYRRIDGVFGQVNTVAAGREDRVLFGGYFFGRFRFAGREVSNVNPEEGYMGQADVMVGAFSAQGRELWVNDFSDMNSGHIFRLAADGAGNATVLGDLDRYPQSATSSFLASYSSSGQLRWSRYFRDSELRPLVLDTQPGGSVVVGAALDSPMQLDGKSLEPSPLLLLQLH